MGCDGSSDPLSSGEPAYPVYGVGQNTCSQFNDNLANEQFQVETSVWLQGYFTAINTTGSARGFTINPLDLERSIDYIKSKCAEPDNADIQVANLTNIFWRLMFNGIEPK